MGHGWIVIDQGTLHYWCAEERWSTSLRPSSPAGTDTHVLRFRSIAGTPTLLHGVLVYTHALHLWLSPFPPLILGRCLRLWPDQSRVFITRCLLLVLMCIVDAVHVRSAHLVTVKWAPYLTPHPYVHLLLCVDMSILYWNWFLKCWACRISSERPFRMETWRPATESAASLLHWEKIRQGESFSDISEDFILFLLPRLSYIRNDAVK